MDVQRYLFTDRREDEGNVHAGRAATLARDERLDDLLARLRRVDWRHPALLVYREQGENRWSYVMLGLSSPELGEG